MVTYAIDSMKDTATAVRWSQVSMSYDVWIRGSALFLGSVLNVEVLKV